MKKSTKRNTRKPPPRLSWPASLVTENYDADKHRRKRLRKIENSLLWVDKFAPIASVDLCVAPKKIKECEAWLKEATKLTSSAPRKKLLVLVGSPGCGKSTMVRVLAMELGLEVHTWNESFVAKSWGDRNFDLALSVEHTSALDSFEEFLVQCGAGFSSLQLTTDTVVVAKRSLVLLEDLPNLHGPEAERRFRRIMAKHLTATQVPTILVFSDVSEGKHKPADLERLIDPNELYSSSSLICQIHPVTRPKMKKILGKISSQQKCQIPPTFFEDLYLQSDGDIRHAILTLQLQCTGLKSVVQNSHLSSQQNDRDQKLSTFHALGKLLYAKRTLDSDGNPCLAFDPEEILERSDMGVAGSLRFLEYHSTEFFTQIEDLGDAFCLFSDAATLLDNKEHSYENNPVFPEGCASSIAGRAVAKTNRHPAPNKFRQLSTPRVFDVIRKRRQNEVLMTQLAHRLSESHLTSSTALAGSHVFVTELLPVMRLILPDVVNPSVDKLYSITRESMVCQAKSVGPSNEAAILNVQDEILEVDDIQDFDSDKEQGAEKSSYKKQTSLTPGLEHQLSQKENIDSTNDKTTRNDNNKIIIIDDSD